MSEPIHLRPAAELAPRVLLPGDPHRALAVAQDLLEEPRMFNHHRGLWGYTGAADDGELLSVQATGMGGPSAAIVVEELIGLGARTLVRIGTCGALNPGLMLGELLAVEAALATDGTSRALGAGERVVPDPQILAALAEQTGKSCLAASTDLFYGEGSGTGPADVVEMEAATVFQVARNAGVQAGCLLGVTDLIGADGRRRIDHEGLEALGLELGRTAYAALATR
ncbi:MAG: purine-nucleoside phosphorylase [Thermoleophilaceae bacterium]|nr:purine-nucleoside phosphorylase [Thermoleophilaceae bacterium]